MLDADARDRVIIALDCDRDRALELGHALAGKASWIKIGMTVQPGEFAKVTVLLLAASVVAKYEGRLDDPREYIKALIILAIPFLCIMTQPDLGTGLVYLFIDATA